ncbi:MAG: C25 family cysteine peptidase, partial [Candidatus Kapaibacterium sp.]
DEQSSYFLTWGEAPGLRAKEMESAPAPYAQTPTQFTARVFQEEELVNAYAGGSGRRWFGQQIDAVLPRTFATKLPGLVRSGAVEYVIDVAHKEAFSPDLSAKVSVSENGSAVTNIPLIGVNESGYAEYVSTKVKATVPAQALNPDGNSYLRFEYANPYVSGGGNAFLDFFEIHYPAVCSAINDELTVYSEPGMTGSTQYSIGGFSNASLVGFDVTDPRTPLMLRNTSSVGNIFQFAVSLDSMKGPRKFYLTAKVRSAEPLPVTWSYLRDDDASADVIVVAADEFLESARSFASYRSTRSGLNVRVVPLSTIVNEFGSGIADPGAVRDFISHAYRSWSRKPGYVILWGDGHYDYKNISTQRVNYIPSWQTIETDDRFNDINIGYYTSSYVTDDFFVRIVGDDDVTDIPIGRLPIDSRATGEAMVAKIRHYEESSARDLWRTTATFVADDGPTSNGRSDGDLHTYQSEVLSNDSTCVPEDVIERKIYMAEYPAENIPKGKLKPRVTEDILATVNNQGTLLLNWIGHGNPKVWAHETVLSRDVTIPQFTNYDKLFFLVAATCDFGRWDLPESQSGAELMLSSRRGGSIGAFTSSRVSFSTLNAIIGRALFRKIFSRGRDGRYLTLGEIVNATKQLHSGENDQKYMLLGDPTL